MGSVVGKTALDSLSAKAPDSTSLRTLSEKVAKGQLHGIDLVDLGYTWLTKLINFGIKVFIALIIFYIGRFLIKAFIKVFRARMHHRKVSHGVTSFLSSLLSGLGYLLVIIVAVNIIGFQSVSFAALLAAAGVAIGAALSGQLQNLASGVVLLTTRPFHVGDWIEANSGQGTVVDISIFYTTLQTVDNAQIYVPNSKLTSDSLKNTDSQSTRRCQWVVGVEYGTDIAVAKEVMKRQIENDPRLLKTKPILLVLKELGSSSVNIMMRAWCKKEDYWEFTWDVNARIYDAFNEAGLSFAFPSLTVYQSNDSKISDSNTSPAIDNNTSQKKEPEKPALPSPSSPHEMPTKE